MEEFIALVKTFPGYEKNVNELSATYDKESLLTKAAIGKEYLLDTYVLELALQLAVDTIIRMDKEKETKLKIQNMFCTKSNN